MDYFWNSTACISAKCPHHSTAFKYIAYTVISRNFLDKHSNTKTHLQNYAKNDQKQPTQISNETYTVPLSTYHYKI